MKVMDIRNLISNNLSFLGFIPPGRSVNVLQGDTFIVSYPKSGNTWLRFLIGNLIYTNDQILFSNIEKKIPDIYQNSENLLKKFPNPRILKSHEYFDPRYRKVIYIVRDPRDVAVSYFYYLVKMNLISKSYSLSKYIDKFLNGDLDPFGSWKVNVGSWIGARCEDKDFLLLRYEDLLKDTKSQLKSIADFLNVKTSKAFIDRSVDLSSFKSLKQLENKEPLKWKPMRTSDENLPFIRVGKSGQWQKELPNYLANLIEKRFDKLMRKLNYL